MTKTKMIYVLIEKDKYDRIRSKNKNVSELIRSLLDQYLENDPIKPNTQNDPIKPNTQNDPINTNDPIKPNTQNDPINTNDPINDIWSELSI